MNDLFLDLPAEQFEKGADTRLPADMSQWDHAILNSLAEQHPYIPLEDYRLVMNAKDAEMRNAVGNIVIKEGVQIPVLVEQGRLKPFDMFLKEGKYYTMNSDELRQVLHSPSFGEPIPPGQGEIADVFLTHTRPPFDGKYTFAAMIGDKASYEDAFTTVYNKEGEEYLENDPILQDILGEAGSFPVEGIEYQAKTASIVKSAAVPIQTDEFEPIDKTGSFKVQGQNGKIYRGWHFSTIDKGNLFVPFSKHAYDYRFGKEAETPMGGIEETTGKLPDDEVGHHGAWVWTDKYGGLRSTSPVEIERDFGKDKYAVKNSFGSQLLIQKDASFQDGTKVGSDIFLPESATFMRLNPKSLKIREAEKRSALFEDPFMSVLKVDDGQYRVELQDRYKEALDTELPESLTEKQAAKFLSEFYEPESVKTVLASCKRRSAVFLKAPMVEKRAGVDEKKLAKTIEEITPRIQKNARVALKATMQIRNVPDLSDLKLFDFSKAAADFADEEMPNTLDTALGLNILTDENILKYVEFIDLLDSARQVCLKLLLASRLGLPIDDGAARSAAYALDAVISDLRRLRTVYAEESVV